MRFWALPPSNLLRRPVRSALTVVGLAVAFSSFITFIGFSRGLERAWIDALHERGTHILAVGRKSIEVLSATIDENVAIKLSQVRGVSEVSGELVDLVELEGGESALVTGWPAGSHLWSTVQLLSGGRPNAGGSREVIVGEAIAETLGKRVGDTIELGETTFTITGISKAAGTLISKAVVVPLTTMQEVQGKQGKVTIFHIRLQHPGDSQEARAVEDRLTDSFPILRFSQAEAIGQNDFLLRVSRAMTWTISSVALVMALLMIFNTLLMSVTERKHEIGIFSAVGWQVERVVAMIALEGLTLAVVGSVLGAFLGIGALYSLAGVPQIHGLLKPEVTGRTIAEISAATLLLGVVGSAYPAWRAARMDPVEALRSR